MIFPSFTLEQWKALCLASLSIAKVVVVFVFN